MSTSEQNPRIWGNHRAWIEGEDAVFVEWVGDVTRADIESVGVLLKSMPGTGRALTLIQDQRRMGHFSAEARKKVVEDRETLRLRFVILVGASYRVRIVQGMLQRALQVMNKATARVFFFDNMEQAREFIEKNRSNR